MSMSSLICKSLHHLRSATRASSPTHHHNLYFLQNHPFSSSSSSSSSSSLETTPNQHSFAVNYFINSCGFPLEKAISASNYVKFKTPNKPDSVLAFLENHGFTKTQISNLVRKHPPVILCEPEKTFLPKFQFFKSKGVSSTDVVKILSSEPSILKRSLENTIIPSFNLLKKLTDSPVEIIKRCARVLFFDLQVSVVPNIEILREAGVPNAKIVSFFKYEPRRFMTTSDRFRKIVNEVKKMGFNPVSLKFVIAFQAVSSMSKSTWEKKVEVYKKWGWSEDEILVAFEKYPWCMMASEHKIMRVMEFFVNKMGWDSSFLARSPTLIGYSLEKRIVPRCAVYQVLMSKGLIKNNNFNLTNMLKKPEQWFLKKVVNCHEEEAPELLKLYKEKLGLAK
ncbi:hypothetical protein LOK49_LG08G03152 [Camellia lanceoleosa]|uniref:Uncharacterized protein n=1 Tax=Camellia lanceoleosa TaxID=1840588 RepID=A0ACC0GWK7_9ERIC|nr:hypothetical protein LOK49_LG08G03152 [Camellia lanceoleosa]